MLKTHMYGRLAEGSELVKHGGLGPETFKERLGESSCCWKKSGEKTTWDVKKTINNGRNYQPQLVNAGVLNHQQSHLVNLRGD